MSENFIQVYPNNPTNSEFTEGMAIPTAKELAQNNIIVKTWEYAEQDDALITHRLILAIPPEMLLYKFFAIIRLALDWNDAEYKCIDLKPLGDKTWEFTFTFQG